MLCSNCGGDNPENARFCIECASPFARRCPSCGTENPPHAKFCAQCATHLSGRSSSALPAALPVAPRQNVEVNAALIEGKADAPLDGERKMVTALFADIRGSTELMEDLDPEEARAIIDPALKLMIEAVQHYDGYVVQSTGDGIFALFGAPVAHEDHPQRALYAALRLQEVTKKYSAKLVAQGGTALEARVGINTGEVVMRTLTTSDGHAEYSSIGHTANLAARMQTIASTGSIAITEHVRRLVEGYFQLKPRGPVPVKGLTGPVDVYEVIGIGPLRTRLQRAAAGGLTNFVGRQREMDVLTRAAKQARDGRGQIVAVMAEPGLGKSRLFYEFKAIEGRANWTVFEGYCVSYGKASAYLPVLDLLRSYFEITVRDDERRRREKVVSKIAALDRALEDSLPYLISLLGITGGDDPLSRMDSLIKKRRTLDAIKRVALCESLNQPLMVVFEDLHWIDEQSQELLNLLAESIAKAQVLLLVNYRPEYRHDWNRKTYYSQLRLDPLQRESAEDMAGTLLSDEPALAPVRQLLIERTEGNPFFMEEMVHALFEEGVLAMDGSTRLVKTLVEVKVPTTVSGVLASRIDRLPSAQKELLQTLSMIGREFPVSLVRRVTETRDYELEQMLMALQAAEFIYEQPATADVGYIFKHALTQEVAYGSVLIERRRATHERVAQAIEALHDERIEEHLSELAYHYRGSNNTSKAIEFMRRAAAQAADRSAISEADSQLRDALSLLASHPTMPEHDFLELELQIALCILLASSSFGAPEREQPLRRAYELSERIGNDGKTIALLYQLGQFYVEQARFGELTKTAERAVTLADHVKDRVMESGAHEILGECRLWTGDLRAAPPSFKHALALSEDIPPPLLIRTFGFDLWAIAHVFLAIADLVLGWPERAMQSVRLALERAHSSPHLFSHALVLIAASFQWWLCGDADGASEILIRVRNICDEYGFTELAGLAKQVHGWSHFWQGERADGLAEMREAVHELKSVGAYIFLPCRFALLAEMELENGDHQSAEELVKQAMETLRQQVRVGTSQRSIVSRQKLC